MNNKELNYDDDKLIEAYSKINEFYTNSKINYCLRLGQFLMNELKPSEINPEIFYEKNEIVAMVKFFETYCVE